jgi:hypothetical protein
MYSLERRRQSRIVFFLRELAKGENPAWASQQNGNDVEFATIRQQTMQARLQPVILGVDSPERRRIHENLKAYIERHGSQYPSRLLRQFQLRRDAGEAEADTGAEKESCS